MEIKGKYCKDIKVFTENIEESAIKQLYEIAGHPAYADKKIRIMPDTHSGRDCVIGFSMPIDFEKDYIAVGAIGCDIGCKVSATFFDKPIPEDKYAEFEHKVRKEIPFGMDIHKDSQVPVKVIIKAFNTAQNRLCSMYPQFSEYRIDMTCEKDLENWCRRIRIDYGTFLKSLGSTGGGNHFIEYDVNDELGKYAILIHSGSRNLGLKVFNYWDKIAKSMTINKDELKALEAKAKEKVTDKKKIKEAILKAREEYLSKKLPGFLDGENLMCYLIDVLFAQEYAKLNHQTMIGKISEIYRKLANGNIIDEVHSTHNYIDYDFSALTGKPNMMLRKGSIRSYKGERMIIPFNMRDGVAICEGKSNEEWLYTAPHGSGRAMSRSKAKANINIDTFKEQMKDVYSTSVCSSTIDEAPDAYKPTDEVVELIKDTCDVLFFLKPKINLKATNGE